MLVLAALLLPATFARAESVVSIWTNLYQSGLNGFGEVSALKPDASGNVYVTGGYEDGNGMDFLTIKYSKTGTAVWTNKYDGPTNGFSPAEALALDGSGDVYVAGSSGTGSEYDFVTIKYTSAGVPLWTNRYNGPGIGVGNSDDHLRGMALDGDGNAYVVGNVGVGSAQAGWAAIKYSSAGLPLWTNLLSKAGGGVQHRKVMALDGNTNVCISGFIDDDLLIVKYSSAGALLWTNRYSEYPFSPDSPSMTVDGPGNVYVAGQSSLGGGDTAYGTLKYSAEGVPLWTNRYNQAVGDSVESVQAIAVDGGGNVFVTGLGQTTPGIFVFDYVTLKYSATGQPAWTNRYNGPGNGSDFAMAMTVDGSGNAYVTGGASGAGVTTIKYAGTGTPVWTNSYMGPQNAGGLGYALAVDAGDNLFVGGGWRTTNGWRNYFTLKYSPSDLPFQIDPARGFWGVTNEQFAFTFTGPLGSNAVVEVSTNTSTWSPWQTNLLTDGTASFLDSQVTNYLNRFYRGRLLP